MAFNTFEVHGHGGFPLDMLRYDACFPAREEDAAAIEQSIRRREGKDGYHRTVRLGIAGRKRRPSERWESYGWYVKR